jgi:hypothetical protein
MRFSKKVIHPEKAFVIPNRAEGPVRNLLSPSVTANRRKSGFTAC